MRNAFIDTDRLFPKVIVPIYIPARMNTSIGSPHMLCKPEIVGIFFLFSHSGGCVELYFDFLF